eukprot:tig00020610_g11988.t1
MFPLVFKKCELQSYRRILSKYVSKKIGEPALAHYEPMIQLLERLQSAVCAIQSGGPVNHDGRDNLHKYFSQLLLLEANIYAQDARAEEALKIEYCWTDLWNPKKKISMTNIGLEKAGVLLQLALYNNQLGIQSSKSARLSYSYFAAAAGVVAHLQESMLTGQLRGAQAPDLSQESLSGLYSLFLAHAYACYYANAIEQKQAKDGVMARLAAQSAIHYGEAVRAFTSLVSAYGLDKHHYILEGARRLHAHYQAEANYRMALVLHEGERPEVGKAIAHLQLAAGLLSGAGRERDGGAFSALRSRPAVSEEDRALLGVVQNHLDALLKENAVIYQHAVPPPEALQPVPGLPRPLVKPTPFSPEGPRAGAGEDPWSGGQGPSSQGAGTVRHFAGPMTVQQLLREVEYQATAMRATAEQCQRQMALKFMEPGAGVLPPALFTAVLSLKDEAGERPVARLEEDQGVAQAMARECRSLYDQIEGSLSPLAQKELFDELRVQRVSVQKGEQHASNLQERIAKARPLLERLSTPRAELLNLRPYPGPGGPGSRGAGALGPAGGAVRPPQRIVDMLSALEAAVANRDAAIGQLRARAQRAPQAPANDAEVEGIKARLDQANTQQLGVVSALEAETGRMNAEAPDHVRQCESMQHEFEAAVTTFREIQAAAREAADFLGSVQDTLRKFAGRAAERNRQLGARYANYGPGPQVNYPPAVPPPQNLIPTPYPGQQQQGRAGQPGPPPGLRTPRTPGSDISATQSDQIRPDQVQFGPVLGRGGFGRVYLGTWLGTEVAIKELMVSAAEMAAQARDDFRAEVETLRALRHPNVIQFFGAYENNNQLYIVTEFAQQGHLRNFLTTKRPNFEQKISVIFNVLCGMMYLVSLEPPILHRDLKSFNVLMMADGRAKLADFGLARIKSEAQATISAAGTPAWMAPELLRGETGCTEQSDVFSFGVLVWEIVTEDLPWVGIEPIAVVGQVGFNKRRLTIPADVHPALKHLISQCWEEDPARRPTFRRIHDEFTRAFAPLVRVNLGAASSGAGGESNPATYIVNGNVQQARGGGGSGDGQSDGSFFSFLGNTLSGRPRAGNGNGPGGGGGGGQGGEQRAGGCAQQ